MKNNEIIHKWSIACDESLVNQNSNLLSLHNIIDEITVSGLNVDGKKVDSKDLNEKNTIIVPKNVDYVSLWRRNPLSDINIVLERKVKLEWVSPSGKVLITNESLVKIEANKQNMRVIFKIDRLAITVPGTYCIRLCIKNPNDKSYEAITETPIEIKIV